ncbi:hypothetical protein ACFQDN_21560 [Pseudomonas asuensis]|uniref:Uncharacterized protein n=1 Tax=Pseudomonas asuensis TaxID=1825787 RepID=A0ABQ2H2K8_9PSED|nr:hypothetical protein [Pseudomonas asuensis]GGM26167.1 hypothetical protein GCM10009425_41100 [Pseudomonas asuensis]
MNLIWWVLKSFYLLGLFAVVPLGGIFILNFGRHPEVGNPVIALSFLYFIFGYFLLRVIPKWMESRLMDKAKRFKLSGFKPEKEIISLIYNRYLGFDSKSRSVLFIDINDGTEVIVPFDKIKAWQVDNDCKKAVLMKLLTQLPNMPVIGLNIKRSQFSESEAYLYSIFS